MWCVTAWVCIGGAPRPVSAQVVELVGSRALGMGGAFVAVASDSSATWWNPAGLAAGPFVDVALGSATVEMSDKLPVWRHKASWFALGTPMVGVSYYRFRITDIQPFDPTGQGGAGRQDRRAGVPVRSLSARQFGVTLVQALVTDIHVGATLKYVRGTFSEDRDDGLAPVSELLDRGEALDEGGNVGRFDMDVGLLAVAGTLRIGATMRNVLQPEFGTMRLPRQVRVGVAVDRERVGGVPLTIAVDADVTAYRTPTGRRRVVALGGERWLMAKRVGVRAGARMNAVGPRERSATAGASVAIRTGVYVDGHAVRGGSADDKGWGLAARVSF